MSEIIKEKDNVVVIGGGPSGMVASIFASKNNNVILIEKNEKLGKKLYITGKGRCNITNRCQPSDFLNNVIRNSKFIYGSIYRFSPDLACEFLENNGLNLKTERGNRVFPLSDKASDVTKTLEKILIKNNVKILLNEKVEEILTSENEITGVKTNNQIIKCKKVIVATGGISYPLTGSTGDGYKFAKKLGHKITDLRPSLVGIELQGNDFKSLQGLSLKNVSVKCIDNDKKIYEDFGEIIFTHFGVSGPIILSSSCHLNRIDLTNSRLVIDLKPALSDSVLDDRLIREFTTAPNKMISSVLSSLLPKSLISLIVSRSNIVSDKKCCEITKKERQNLMQTLKNLSFEIKKLRPIEEAIVTSGGVSVDELNPKTMASKIVKGLYFCGEVIDVDAYTGGFNIQIAMSTGYTAGSSL